MACPLRQSSFSHGEQRELRTDEFRIVAEAFLELFELLEEYAPVWYTERHHNRADAAKKMLLGLREKRNLNK